MFMAAGNIKHCHKATPLRWPHKILKHEFAQSYCTLAQYYIINSTWSEIFFDLHIDSRLMVAECAIALCITITMSHN